jgi:hypothetical protein
MERSVRPEEAALRDLVRAREAVRVDLMRCRHRLSKLLLRHGHRSAAACNPVIDRLSCRAAADARAGTLRARGLLEVSAAV